MRGLTRRMAALLCASWMVLGMMAGVEHETAVYAGDLADENHAAIPLQDSTVQNSETPKTDEQESGTEPDKEPQDPEQAEETVYLGIDTVHTYERMNKPFSQGYLPSVEGDTVHLAVPFTATGPLKNDSLTVRLKLSKDGPFLYASYEKTVEKQSFSFEDDQTEAYFYLCEVKLTEDRINGTYPVTVQAEGYDMESRPVQLECRLFVTVTDGKEADSGSGDVPEPEGDPAKEEFLQEETGSLPEDQEELPQEFTENGMETGGNADFLAGGAPEENPGETDPEVLHQPKMILEPNDLAEQKLVAGEETSLTAVFRNRSREESAYNLKVTAVPAQTTVALKTASFYFEKVSPQETMEIPLEILISPQAEQGSVAVDFTFEYETEEATACTGTEQILLNISQPVQVTMEGFDLPETVFAAETSTVHLQIRNLGRAPVYNVQAELSGEGLFPMETIFAGNLDAGTSSDGTMRVYAGNRLMQEIGQEVEGSEEEKYGPVSGTLTLTCEDAYGQQYSWSQEFSTVIQKPAVTELKVEKTPEKTNQWWAAVFLLLALLAFGGMGVLGWRLRYDRKRMALLLAEREVEKRKGPEEGKGKKENGRRG